MHLKNITQKIKNIIIKQNNKLTFIIYRIYKNYFYNIKSQKNLIIVGIILSIQKKLTLRY